MFLSFFGTFGPKVDQTWFVLRETWRTTLFGKYYFVEVVLIKNHGHMQDITCQDAIYLLLSFFCTFVHKVAQIWFVLHETWHTTLLGINYCVEMVIMKILVICYKVTCYIAI